MNDELSKKPIEIHFSTFIQTLERYTKRYTIFLEHKAETCWYVNIHRQTVINTFMECLYNHVFGLLISYRD